MEQKGIGEAELVDQRDFLRALAKSLLGDDALVEEVVQDAFLAAIRRPPASGVSLRSWLGKVVANRSRNVGRGERRRVRRELAAARPEAIASPDEIGERLETQQRVLAAVRALREPYRGTIYHRYYEDLTPSEIARRTGEPVKTVKTRLARGIRMLREALEREWGGERDACCAALLPVAYGREALSAGCTPAAQRKGSARAVPVGGGGGPSPASASTRGLPLLAARSAARRLRRRMHGSGSGTIS